MNDFSRDIIFLLKEHHLADEFVSREIAFIHKVIAGVDNDHAFCQAHELVMRNRITQRKKRIKRAANRVQLKAFYFLINKN